MPPVFETPLWVQRLAVLIVFAGFPVALPLAWFYELGPSGLRRDPGGGDWQGARGGLRRMDFAILELVVLSVAVTVVRWRTEVFGSRSATVATAIGGARPIAVLPFESLSPDRDNAYFADGMQEQILTQLTSLSGLKTISHTSTAKYASHPEDVQMAGRYPVAAWAARQGGSGIPALRGIGPGASRS